MAYDNNNIKFVEYQNFSNIRYLLKNGTLYNCCINYYCFIFFIRFLDVNNMDIQKVISVTLNDEQNLLFIYLNLPFNFFMKNKKLF